MGLPHSSIGSSLSPSAAAPSARPWTDRSVPVSYFQFDRRPFRFTVLMAEAPAARPIRLGILVSQFRLSIAVHRLYRQTESRLLLRVPDTSTIPALSASQSSSSFFDLPHLQSNSFFGPSLFDPRSQHITAGANLRQTTRDLLWFLVLDICQNVCGVTERLLQRVTTLAIG